MDYLNSEPMQPNESARNMAESPWEKFIDTHGFSQHIIQKDDPQVSLKTALDYVRRLFVVSLATCLQPVCKNRLWDRFLKLKSRQVT